MDPSLRVAVKIRPYFILVLDGGPATAFGLGFAPRYGQSPRGPRFWPNFPSQRCAPVYVDTPWTPSVAPSAIPITLHLLYPLCMEFKVSELEREPVEFGLQLEPGAIDFGEEAEQAGPLAASGVAEVIHEHRGPKEIVADIRLKGRYAGRFEVPCARCIEPVEIPLEAEFDLIFRPIGADVDPPERSITASETEIGYYQGDSLLLEDVLREQVLLSLPARTLCKPDCKGLCPRCGANRNTQPCSCEEGPKDPRWEALTGLRSRIKS